MHVKCNGGMICVQDLQKCHWKEDQIREGEPLNVQMHKIMMLTLLWS